MPHVNIKITRQGTLSVPHVDRDDDADNEATGDGLEIATVPD